eukprot:TRINITY_DN301_c0_g1_i4.p1 TRINITY_DN301_c0_g1~~TRINITY_DN301_c0_g1_i4.p1  ORF type:complete len:251 (-),score=39.21 TRINITY_DN301_c0_g1_i4:191-943(-)
MQSYQLRPNLASPEPRDWKNGFCDCGGSEVTGGEYIYAFCCPCCMAADTKSELNKMLTGRESDYKLLMCGVCICFGLIGADCVGCFWRTKMREELNIKGDQVADCCQWFWCCFTAPCAACQELSEIRRMKEDRETSAPGLLYSPSAPSAPALAQHPYYSSAAPPAPSPVSGGYGTAPGYGYGAAPGYGYGAAPEDDYPQKPQSQYGYAPPPSAYSSPAVSNAPPTSTYEPPPAHPPPPASSQPYPQSHPY